MATISGNDIYGMDEALHVDMNWGAIIRNNVLDSGFGTGLYVTGIRFLIENYEIHSGGYIGIDLLTMIRSTQAY